MAAELFITPIVKVTLSKLISFAENQLNLVVGCEEELSNFCVTLEMVKGLLEHAEQRQATGDGRVRAWLNELRRIADEAAVVLDEIAYDSLQHKVASKHVRKQVSYLCTFSNPLLARRSIALKINSLNDGFAKVNRKANELGLEKILAGNDVERRGLVQQTDTSLDPSETVVGRDRDIYEVVRLLTESTNDQSLAVVSLVGVGGLGKTTLAKLICNNEQVRGHFGKIIWVCVSEDFDVLGILKEMGESLGMVSCREIKNQNAVFEKIKNKLREENYLLVLDDVWEEDEQKWRDLKSCLVGMTQNVGSSRVLVTTRIPCVATLMGSVLGSITLLSDEDCWSIIKQRAFCSTFVPPELKEIGRNIATKCKGVPLVANVLGGTLRDHRNYDYWLSIEKEFDACCPLVDNDRVVRVLKLSFDRLPNPVLKQCFSFCSIFPKDYVMEKEMLIQIWMAEGFLQQHDSSKEMEDIGEDYLKDLVSYFFFQDVKWDVFGQIISCKMHDLMHDLAKSVFKSETLILESSSSNAMHDIRHLNIICAPSMWPAKTVEVIQQLHSLFSMVNDFGMKSVNFKRLLVLSFLDADIHELPVLLGKLKRLKYLDISGTKIKEFPKFLKKLYLLQTFRFKGCRYIGRPLQGIGDLISLKHICFSDSWLMPSGIGSMTCLQTLSLFVVGRKEGHGIEELEHLSQLKGDLEISNLSAIKDRSEAMRAKLCEKAAIVNLKLCFVAWSNEQTTLNSEKGEDHADVLEGLKPHPSLKGLTLTTYEGQSCPSWLSENAGNFIGSSYLRNLVSLKIEGCQNLLSIPSLSLSNLTLMEIRECAKLEKIPSLFFSSPAKLEVDHCMKLKDIADLSLRNLSIDGCFELVNVDFGPCAVTSLQELNIRGCDGLKDLQMVSRLQSLQILCLRLCDKLRCIGDSGLFTSTCLKEIFIENCNGLISIPSVDGQSYLQKLIIKNCSKLISAEVGTSPLPGLKEIRLDSCCGMEGLPVISESPRLQKLFIASCPNLRGIRNSVTSFASSKYLVEVTLIDCGKLMSIPSLGGLSFLQRILIEKCQELTSIGEDGLSASTYLRELKISVCPALTFIPSLDGLSSLERVFIQNCQQLESIVGRSLSSSKKLKELNISSCPVLKSIPSLDGLSSLEKIWIKDCQQLIGIKDESCFQLYMCLKQIYISNCHALTSIPSIDGLSFLETIFVENCQQLECIGGKRLSSSRRLKEFNVSECPTLTTIPSLDRLSSSLEVIVVRKCLQLEIIGGESLSSSTGLVELNISECAALTSVPNLDGLLSLGVLFIEKCEQLKSIGEESLSSSTRLKLLKISECAALESIPNVDKLSSIVTIIIKNCPQLESIGGKSLSSCKRLVELNISGCDTLKSIPSLDDVSSLETIFIENCQQLGSIEGKNLSSSTRLRELSISGCDALTSIPSLDGLTSLETFFIGSFQQRDSIERESLSSSPTKLTKLIISGCAALASIPNLGDLSFFEMIIIENCHQLESIAGWSSSRLTELRISGCPALTSMNSGCFSSSKIAGLCIVECPSLTSIPSLDGISSLETIFIENCQQLRTIEGRSLASSTRLRELNISGCVALTSIPSLYGLSSLKFFFMGSLQQRDNIERESLASPTKPTELIISGCASLTSIPHLGDLSFFEMITIDNCQQLDSIAGWNSYGIKELRISGCPALTSIDKVCSLPSEITGLCIVDCPALTSIPSLYGVSSLQTFFIGSSQQWDIERESLSSATKLRELIISGCAALTSIPHLGNLSFFETIIIENCQQLKSIAGWQSSRFVDWRISGCPALTSIEEVCFSTSKIAGLYIVGCPALTSVLNTWHLQLLSLRGDCELIRLTNWLSSLSSLSCLELSPFSKELEEFPDLSFIQHLHDSVTRLALIGWEKQNHFPHQIQCLTSLQSLMIRGFSQLEALPEWLGDLSYLKHLTIRHCISLKQFPSVEVMQSLSNLQDLEIFDCPELIKKGRSKRTVPEWNKISRIPRIKVDGEVPKDGELAKK